MRVWKSRGKACRNACQLFCQETAPPAPGQVRTTEQTFKVLSRAVAMFVWCIQASHGLTVLLYSFLSKVLGKLKSVGLAGWISECRMLQVSGDFRVPFLLYFRLYFFHLSLSFTFSFISVFIFFPLLRFSFIFFLFDFFVRFRQALSLWPDVVPCPQKSTQQGQRMARSEGGHCNTFPR